MTLNKTLLSSSLNSYPTELIELDQLLMEILDDVKHPLNDPKHPDHPQSKEAYKVLVETAETLRLAWMTGPESKNLSKD